MVSKWIIGFFLSLLLTGVAKGALKEATWTEFKPPKVVRKITYSGRVGVGYQSVQDILREKWEGISTDTDVDLIGPVGEGMDIEAGIQAKKQASTVGREEMYDISLGFKGDAWRVGLGGELSEISNIVDEVNYQSKVDSISTDINISILENLPLTLNYSRRSGKNSQEDLTTEQVSTEEFKFLLESQLGIIQTDLGLNLTETSDLVEGLKTRTRGLGLNFAVPVAKILQINLGVWPAENETISEDESEKVSSEQIEYTVGLETKFSEKFRFVTSFSLINALYESADTETEEDTFSQNYTISYQPSAVFELDTTLELLTPKELNKSQSAAAKINYSPEEKRFLSQAEFGIQTNKVEDNTGRTQSESMTLNLNSLFKLTEAMDLSSNLAHSTQEAYSSGSDDFLTTSNDLNVKFCHKLFKDFTYGLGYYFVDREETEGDSEETTNGYLGDIVYNLRVGARDLPISLGHTLTYSQSEEQKIDTQTTEASVKIPLTSLISISYSYRKDQAQTETEIESTSDETKENAVGLEFRGKTKPFRLNAKYSLIDSRDDDTQCLNTSFSYSISDKLSFNLNFIHDRILTAETTRILVSSTVGLVYTF